MVPFSMWKMAAKVHLQYSVTPWHSAECHTILHHAVYIRVLLEDTREHAEMCGTAVHYIAMCPV